MGVVAQLAAAFNVLTSPENGEADMLSLVEEWRNFFKTSEAIDTSPGHISVLATMMSTFLDAPTREEELLHVAAAAKNPLYGLTLALAALPGTAKRQAQQYWNMNFAEQTLDGSITGGWRKVKTLLAPREASNEPDEAPTEATRAIKYLIMSDLHRDAASDDRGPLQLGSIDHFKANNSLYERILSFADTGGYTVIEGGDCEELWFVNSVVQQDAPLDIAAKLQEIIRSHSGVYERLRNLHRDRRYFRVQGNHDSFLKEAGSDDTVGAILRAEMQKDGGDAFVIYDAFVIPGIKSMMEHAPLDNIMRALELPDKPPQDDQDDESDDDEPPEPHAQAFFATLIAGLLGLDSNDYLADTKMLVMHGHQFDFWNCPENQILGLLIANSVGMFVDRNMDPFLDLRGIALQGNPWIDFGTAFAGWPVFNSWVSRKPSVRFAHDVQHMPNGERQLNDTIMFSESMALLRGTLGIALNHLDAAGEVIATPAESRQQLDLNTPTGLGEYLSRHHLHHLCIGHTHNPHSQPFLTIQDLAKLAPPLGPVLKLIRSFVPDALEPNLKTTYFNSATGGWMEGVVWAIEIDASGQARLAYWTENSVGPEYMDWELQPLDPTVKSDLLKGLENALQGPADEALNDLKKLRESLDARLQELAVATADKTAALGAAVTLPFYSLAASLRASTDLIKERFRQLQEMPSSIEQRLQGLKDQFGQLRDFNYDTFLSIKRHAFVGFAPESDVETDTETLVIRAPISTSERERLERVQRVLVQMGASQDEALHYAGVAVAAFGEFPLNMPFFSTMLQPLDPMGLLEASESPVLYGLLSTLWMYPPVGQVVDIWGVKLTSRFELQDSEVSLTVVIQPGESVVPGGPVVT